MPFKSFEPAKSTHTEIPRMASPNTFRACEPPQLNKFRHYDQPSLAFSAKLLEGKIVTQGSYVGQDIADQLNQLPKRYMQDAVYAGNSRDLRILDDKLNVFHVQSTPAVAAVLKSSHPACFQLLPPNNPGRAQLGQVSGVQTTSAGDQFRLVDQRLYRFEAQNLCWLPDKDDAQYSRLGLSKEGSLIKVPEGVADISVEGNTQVSLAPASGDCSLRISRGPQAPELHLLPVNASGEPVQLSRIGLAANTLYGSTPHGELLCANLSSARAGRINMLPEPVGNLEQLHKGAISIKGFMHDDHGQLNALLLDKCKQLHSSPLIKTSLQATGWNLSDVMLKVNDKGLPQPGLRALASEIDLGARGRVALEGSTLLYWDEHARQWVKTPHQDVDQLTLGLDGRAYVLQGAELRALATHRTRDPGYSGASYDFVVVDAPRTHITLDDTMTANGGRKLTGFAVDNARRFVTLDDRNRLTVHVNGTETVLKFARPEAIEVLVLDRLGDLYAQSATGQLLKLDKALWQNPGASELAWTSVTLPGNERLKSLRMDASQQLVASWGQNDPKQKNWGEKYWQLSVCAEGVQQWKPFGPQSNPPVRPLAALLSSGEIKSQDKGTSWAVTSAVMGNKTEGLPVARGFLKGVRAHMEPVQGVKNIGLDIQHRFTGRRGLEELYADELDLQGQLDALANATPTTTDLTTRLARLSEQESTQALADELRHFLGQVESHSEQLAMRLGALKGARVVPQHQPAVADTPAKRSAGVLHKMCKAFDNHAPSKTNVTAALLRSYESQGVTLSPRNSGQKRDLSNPTGLVESDLIQHARTLSRLGTLIARLEGKAPDQVGIAAGLDKVKDSYQNSQVHKKASQNINGLAQAETLYNNFKLLAKDLGRPGSALNFHIARTMGLNEGQTVKQALLQSIQESPSGQTTAASRSRTKSASLFVSPLPLLEIIVGASRAKTNGISMSRTDHGVSFDISMGTHHAVSGTVGTGTSLFPSPELLENRLRVGVDVTLGLAHENRQNLSFEVKEADLAAMMDILMGDKGDVFDLLDLGSNHKSGQRSEVALDLSASAHVQPRSQMDIPENSDTVSGVVRGMLNAGTTLQLFHGDKSDSVTLGASEVTRAKGSNALLLAKGSVSLGGAPANIAVPVEINAQGAVVAPYTSADTSMTLAFDRSSSRAMRFTFRQPAVIEQAQINELCDGLSRYSPQLTQQLASIAAKGTVVEQLQHLQRLFEQLPPSPARAEEHYDLKVQLHDHLRQQALIAQGQRELKSVERTVSYVGLKGGRAHEWLDDAAPANKAAILQLFAQQPQFARLLKVLEGSQGTSVVIELEVKPQVLRMIEHQVQEGRDAQYDVQKALENTDNLRVKNLVVSYTASRTQGMTTPIPLLSYSSSAALSQTAKLLNMELKYGEAEDVPLRMEFKDSLAPAPTRELHPEQLDQKIRHGCNPLI